MHVPQYRKHPTGQGYAKVGKKFFYFGKFELPESQRKFKQWLADYLRDDKPKTQAASSSAMEIEHLVLGYRDWIKARYDGKAIVPKVKQATAPLLEVHQDTKLDRFDIDEFESLQYYMVGLGWARSYINDRCSILKRMFTWAGQRQYMSMEHVHRLCSLATIKIGDTQAPEPEKVKPVSEEHVTKTLQHLGRIPAAMVQVQLLCAMRPAEVCIMRPCDIDRSSHPWIYKPYRHKNKHRGKNRQIAIGPKAREILTPFLHQRVIIEQDQEAYLFSPQESLEESIEKFGREYARKIIKPNRHYSTHGYSQAVERAAERAGVPHWTTNQLRHTRATEFRKLLGIEQTSTVLGHSNLPTTEIYAERDLEAIKGIAERYG